jgi:hypothetical protein
MTAETHAKLDNQKICAHRRHLRTKNSVAPAPAIASTAAIATPANQILLPVYPSLPQSVQISTRKRRLAPKSANHRSHEKAQRATIIAPTPNTARPSRHGESPWRPGRVDLAKFSASSPRSQRSPRFKLPPPNSSIPQMAKTGLDHLYTIRSNGFWNCGRSSCDMAVAPGTPTGRVFSTRP